jgi:cytochrome c oxidase assembly protein Cox11|tara:strand:+ start:11648 stop:12142 length:495 start_codon:yes stop_codon:yes gene_type:complete
MKYFFRFAVITIIAIILIRPYNFFCNKTNLCQGIIFAKYIPSYNIGTKKIEINFTAKNTNKDLTFKSEKNSIKTVTGKKNIVKFYIKNNSSTNKTIKFRIKYNVSPKDYSQYIKLYQCLCAKSYLLKPGKEIVNEVIFSIKNNFDNILNNNQNNINLIYEIIES